MGSDPTKDQDRESVVFNKIKNRILSYPLRVKATRAIKEDRVDCLKNLLYDEATIKVEYPLLHHYYPKRSIAETLGLPRKESTKAVVVFNSGRVLEEKRGQQIDSMDIVIRVNFQPTNGYEEYVGSRTTIRVMGRMWLFKDSDEIIVRTYNNPDYYKSDLENYSRSPILQETPLFVTRNDAINEFFDPFLGGMMTNGLRAVLVGLSLADKVYIAGHDASNRRHKKGQAITHFPTKSDYPSILEKIHRLNVEQDLDSYFSPLKEAKNTKPMHNTIKQEYLFYDLHPRVSPLTD